MPKLTPHLDLPRCPHCGIAAPQLTSIQSFSTNNSAKNFSRAWRIYQCSVCGGVVTAWAGADGHETHQVFPDVRAVADEIPGRAREYLVQAIASLSAPAGAVMLAASSVDAMLKEKGLSNGSLYARIDEAVGKNLMTADMATWAHEVRLDANDQRHVDQNAGLPTAADAKRVIEFTEALGQFLFVLPARVTRGIAQAKT